MDRSEYMTAEEARLLLGYSKAKMARLLDEDIAEGERLIAWARNPLDQRMKLVKRADVERLQQYPRAHQKKLAA